MLNVILNGLGSQTADYSAGYRTMENEIKSLKDRI